MKKLLLLFIIHLISPFCFGQVYSISGSNQSITITPNGIMGKLPTPTFPNSNVALGKDALSKVTTGSQNTAIGNNALSKNNGIRNSAFGNNALSTETMHSGNSAFGNGALQNQTAASSNTAFGNFSLSNNTILGSNVAIGVRSLYSQSYNVINNTGSFNTAVGYYALYMNNPTTLNNGRYNTAIGAYSAQNNTIGSENSVMGYKAFFANKEGSESLIIGNNAVLTSIETSRSAIVGNGSFINNLSEIGYNIGIGYNAGADEISNDNLYIANSSTSIPLIGGIDYLNKVAINRNVVTTGGNNFSTRTEALQVGGEAFKLLGNGNWILPSDRRLKKNITPLNSEAMLAKVLTMRGVNYEMKDESQKGIQYGFIAQELREIFPTKIQENADGYLSADYGSYTAIQVEAIKALHEKIEYLEKYNTALAERNTKLAKAEQLITEKLDRIEAMNK